MGRWDNVSMEGGERGEAKGVERGMRIEMGMGNEDLP